MSIENKMVDLSVEANIPYGLLMQFEDVETLLDSENIVPINLIGATFKGAIKDSLDPGAVLLETFTITVIDAAWGGIDGGFDIPTDRNKQPLIWLDYEVHADGSVLVKTYHRTHSDAPVFARNEVNGLNNGDPVDIPRDQFISVRVEMPADSL